MKYLASSIDRLAPEYDVVVIGSGYGGAITASRLARAGLRVCILERGEELQPGDFPEGPTDGMREIQMDAPGKKLGSPTALFDFHINSEISVLSGCGLGGTSLINANVAIEPDERIWSDPAWPEAIRKDLKGRIAEGVQHAREMLRPTPYPERLETPRKLAAMEKSAAAMGARSYRLPITVNFEDGVNHVGVEQAACNNCGNCVGGCNHGAKNTLLTNYLPDAWNHGAEIYTRTRASRVERQGSKWRVCFDLLEAGHAQFNAGGMSVMADTVVIAAGSLGSTEILLRSRQHGLALSDRLGHGFTGNGDVLGFAYNADQPIDCIGVGSSRGRKGPGPCITSVIDLRDTPTVWDGMVIEEGTIPSSLGPIMAASMFLASRLVGRDTDIGYGDYAQEKLRELQALVPGGSLGAIGNMQTFLVMAHDDSQGHIQLVDDRVRIDWPGVGKQPIFDRINYELDRATAALGGTYVHNPMWSRMAGNSLITVHPLGGCGMGETAELGVVDHRGQVFAGTSGDAVHSGLYVCDGSVIPKSVGVNPFLTISALAERTSAIMAEERNLKIPYELRAKPKQIAPQEIGVTFTETMRGFFAMDPALDFQDASQVGVLRGTILEFTATVTSKNLKAMLESAEHRAHIHGTVTLPAISKEPLSVTRGEFQLLTKDVSKVRARRMNYRMPLLSPNGTRYFLHGFKQIQDDDGLDLWSDTTTLYVTLHEGEDEQGAVLGRGILKIHPRDFAKQMRTFKITGAGNLARRLGAAASFGRFFAGTLYDTYGGVFARRTVLDPDAEPRVRRELRVEAPDVHTFQTGDGVPLKLVHYRGNTGEPVMLVAGLGMSSSMFTLDTVDTSLVEYLSDAGRDIWVLDYRGSMDITNSETRFTADDVADQDFPAAVERIRALSGAQEIDVVAQGFGSMAMLMSLVNGLNGVRSVVACQAGLHMVVPTATKHKAGLHLPTVLRALGKDSLGASSGQGWRSRLFDASLRIIPVEAEERCSSPVCRRITFMYGHAYEHDQLSSATHEALHELFGVVNLSVFEHLSKMVRAGEAVRADTGETYLRNLERLAMPITFLHGGDNACFLPESTQQTARVLSDANGPQHYRHVVIPDYGDTDFLIGKNAARDVFPLILAHLRALGSAATITISV